MSNSDWFFFIIASADSFFWSYIGWVIICLSGIYLTIKSRGLQFRALGRFPKNLKEIFKEGSDKKQNGIHPFKLYFASVGGMVGHGNIVGISTAIMIGGPGSIFWTMIASIFGMLLKYSEIYLGILHRVPNGKGGFDGGPMYYLKAATGSNFLPICSAILICLYGVETYQFTILVDRLENTFSLSRNMAIGGLLCLVIYSSLGGIKRLATICTIIMPAFMILYVIMSFYIILVNAHLLPSFCYLIVKSAFTGQAQIGGFAGSTLILSAYLGMSKAVYSGDIGIGYDAIVQSETRISRPKSQATLAIYALLTDTIICLLTNFMVGITGAWYSLNHMQASDVVSTIIGQYFPFSDIFITCLLFFSGFTTLIAFIVAGIKCARFISPAYGKIIYITYAIATFIFFCNFSQDKLIMIMGILSGLLVLVNLYGIALLRKEIKFD